MNKIKFVILITRVTFYIQRLNQYVVYFMITSKTYCIPGFISDDKIWRNFKILQLAILNLTNLAHGLLSHPLYPSSHNVSHIKIKIVGVATTRKL